MYYKVSIKEDAERAVKSLEELGLVLSEFGVSEINDDVKGIATYIDPFIGVKRYILLYANMMCSDPHRSWITSRKEVGSLEELVEGVKESLKLCANKFGNFPKNN